MGTGECFVGYYAADEGLLSWSVMVLELDTRLMYLEELRSKECSVAG